jgi:hypothetical protein
MDLIVTLSMMTLSIKDFIVTLRIMTFSIKDLIVTPSMKDNQYNDIK